MRRLAFVTGAAGFIGRYVCKKLESEGWRVAGIGYGDWSIKEQQTWGLHTWRRNGVSLESLGALAEAEGEPEVIIHCAGGSSVGFSLGHPWEDFERTVVTTASVLEFSRLREGKVALVYPSSAAVYGRTDDVAISEKSQLCPVSPYGVHKRMAEELCQSYASNWSVPVAVVRLFSVYGTELWKQLLWDACVKAKNGDYRFSGSGGEMRDWFHVSDAASLLVLAAMKASPACPIVNGGTGKGISIKSVLEQLGRLWTPSLVPEFSGDQRRGDPKYYIADVGALHSWGFYPQADMKKCMMEYIRWFRSVQQP